MSEPYDCWIAIRNDQRLDRARAKLSLCELQMIIDHVKHGMVEMTVYENAIHGRMQFRQAYREMLTKLRNLEPNGIDEQ